MRKDILPDLDISSMKEMLNYEYENINDNKPVEKDNIYWLNSEVFKVLLKSGYKELSLHNFKVKIKEIFNIDLNNKENCKWKKIDNMNLIIYGEIFLKNEERGLNTELHSEFYESDYSGNILLILDKQFMSFIISPVRIVEFTEYSSYKVKIPQYVISRNKYLFNNDKSQFAWLINNDKEFMESLVKTFGYVQDKKILKWVIENNRFQTSGSRTNGAEYGKILLTKDCSGKFLFHKETLEVMKENISAQSSTNYLDDLLDYMRYLLDEINKDEIKLTFQEKSLVLAHILHFGQNLAMEKEYHKYEFEVMGWFYEWYEDDDKFDKEFSKNNYYDLQNFKNLWEQAKIYGDGMGEPEQ